MQRIGWGGREKEVDLLTQWRLESLELVSSELDLLLREPRNAQLHFVVAKLGTHELD